MLNAQLCTEAKAARYSGAQQETFKSPAIAWRYQEILSAKQAVVGFRRKTWHVESGFDQTT